MIFIIDGTGPDKYSDYYADMSRGFCSNIDKQIKDTLYWRGPNLMGLETWQIGDIVFNEIFARSKENPFMPIILIGHSRGGAACIYVARKLNDCGINVRAMVLLDAVRRATQRPLSEYAIDISNSSSELEMTYKVLKAGLTLSLDFFQVGQAIDRIPRNVEQALVVIRDEEFSNYFINSKEYKELKDSETKFIRKFVGDHNKAKFNFSISREGKRLKIINEFHRRLRDACRFECINSLSIPFSFGNTGLDTDGVKLEEGKIIKCMATHGAIGGSPIEVKSYITDPFYAAQIEAQEVTSMRAIQSKVNGFLKKVGVYEEVKLGYVAQSYLAQQNQTSIVTPKFSAQNQSAK